MITLPNKNFTSDIPLSNILVVMTKAEMLSICKKLDLYVSPNLKKEETARRLALEILDFPDFVLAQFCKAELQVLDKLMKAGPNQYVVVKLRKTPYKLQKFGLVVTYVDYDKGEWHLLMPDSVRESLEKHYQVFLKRAEKGLKPPTPKELRFMDAFGITLTEDMIGI